MYDGPGAEFLEQEARVSVTSRAEKGGNEQGPCCRRDSMKLASKEDPAGLVENC